MAAVPTAPLPLVWDGTLPRRHLEGDVTVVILGGGVTGVATAKTLIEQGIEDFKIIEAREKLGGSCIARGLENLVGGSLSR